MSTGFTTTRAVLLAFCPFILWRRHRLASRLSSIGLWSGKKTDTGHARILSSLMAIKPNLWILCTWTMSRAEIFATLALVNACRETNYTGEQICNIYNSYSKDDRFEPRPGYRLSSHMFHKIPQSFSQMLAQYFEIIHGHFVTNHFWLHRT
jgi:hypothetical protein